MAILTLPAPVLEPRLETIHRHEEGQLPSDMPLERVFRFSVDKYHRMIEAGIIREDERIELIFGWLIKQMTRKPPHDGTLDRVEVVIRDLLPTGWRLRTQRAITTTDSEPEPDSAVVLDGVDRYMDHHPTPAEVAFVGEVADTTLNYDRTTKQAVYSQAAIPIYWIVNINDKQIEVYTDPTGPVGEDMKPHYRNRQDYRPGDSVPLVIAGQTVGEIAVSALLPG